jgi:hypothetical protein
VQLRIAPDRLRRIAGTSLFLLSDAFEWRSDGSVEFRGERPGPDWHGHGFYSTSRGGLDAGRGVVVKLHKHRFRLAGRNATCHAEPPDAMPCMRLDALLVAVHLWAYLHGDRGLYAYPEILPGVGMRVSPRTVARWLHRAVRHADPTQHALRAAVLERCEPRPVEHLFPGGLSPPDGLLRRRWRDPDAVATLWRGLAFLFGAADRLDVSVPKLLAEARTRRLDTPQHITFWSA